MKTANAGLLCVLLGLPSACAQKVDDPSDVQAIHDTQTTFDMLWNAGDVEGLTTGFYAPDAVRMEPHQPALTGKDAIAAALRKFVDQFTGEGRNVAEEVRVSGDLAVARGTFEGSETLKAGGYAAPFEGKWMTAFQRQADGSWKAIWDIYNTDLPVADALTFGEEELALLQVERDWSEALMQKDTAALSRILATEFQSNYSMVVEDKRQALAALANPGLKYESVIPSDMKPIVFGDRGVVHGRSTWKSSQDGEDTSGGSVWTDVFVKRDGRWQCVTGYGTQLQ